jgi:hypothetical protein
MAVSDIPATAMPMKMEIEYVRVFELTAEELAYVNPFPGPVLPVPAADKVSCCYCCCCCCSSSDSTVCSCVTSAVVILPATLRVPLVALIVTI